MNIKELKLPKKTEQTELICPFTQSYCLREQCGCYHKKCSSCAFQLTAHNLFVLYSKIDEIIALNN